MRIKQRHPTIAVHMHAWPAQGMLLYMHLCLDCSLLHRGLALLWFSFIVLGILTRSDSSIIGEGTVLYTLNASEGMYTANYLSFSVEITHWVYRQ